MKVGLSLMAMVLSCLGACASGAASRGGEAHGDGLMASASGPDGAAVFDQVLASEPRTLAVFTTAWCDVCARESPALVAWARAHREKTRVVVVISGSSAAEAQRVAAKRALDPAAVEVVVDATGALADRYAVQATPTLIVFSGATRGGSWQSIEDVPAP
ncbi:MAG: TlpA disulfide reductase family protein [Myxococcota bacterium]